MNKDSVCCTIHVDFYKGSIACPQCVTPSVRLTGHQIITRQRQEQAGFLTDEDVAIIAADVETRLTPILVRCNGGRFTAPAQDVAHFIEIIERDAVMVIRHGASGVPSDWVRDCSLAAAGRGGVR